jgi:hypothetical protein
VADRLMHVYRPMPSFTTASSAPGTISWS